MTFALFHILGSSIASLDEIAETSHYLTDAKYFLIPDGFTVFGLFFVLLTAFIALYFGEAEPFARPWDAILGMCVGAGAISITGWLGEVWLKRPAMAPSPRPAASGARGLPKTLPGHRSNS